ncbi:MAG: hypothetical protein IPJ61_16190 [Tessaracoccus sp.]|uniref:septum site-determining protein Ssd n=1 Tax=Tessaracoccus sp. TaxID=1971211 RepID=UPI001EC0FFEC|nr:septum site-determining protein Ssd [Tessaracoccus sp.]MBK7822550.1 hypothetical protein [Tessaracoccus sp.]
MENTPHALLCARDEAVVEAVEVSAAALGVPLRVVSDGAAAGQEWAGAALRLVSTEVGARWSGVAPGEAFVVGTSAQELARCSGQLGLPVLLLPDDGARLADALRRAGDSGTRRGQAVAVLGATGGLGVSTLTAGLALSAARRGARAAVVDLAEHSGGIDLVLGAEAQPGVRWSGLARVRGEAKDVWDALPRADGVAVLAQDRASPGAPDEAALAAVVASLVREADLVLIDGGRRVPPCAVDRTVLVVGADVRSVASARMMSEHGGISPDGLLVRRGRGRTVPAEVVGRTLGLTCWGEIGDDKALPRLAEMGMPPLPGPARRFARQAAGALRRVSDA